MSIRININGTKYDQLSCAQRAEYDRKRKERLTQVRQQSNINAANVREKVQREKENQLRKLQQIKQQELCEWKKRQQCDIQKEYGKCFNEFGAAHIAVCEASCDEDETLAKKREEYDLLAAERGRCAMLQEQRKRDREAEDRLAKKKRKQLKNVSVQADIVTRKEFGANFSGIPENKCQDEDSFEDETISEVFSSKPNLHKSAAPTYNPKNFTSNSVDSSNNCDSDSTTCDIDSEEEFNQITNMLTKNRFVKADSQIRFEEKVEISDCSENEMPVRLVPKEKLNKKVIIPKSKGILKKSLGRGKVEPKSSKQDNQQRVQYIDFANKYSSSYVPSAGLVTQNNSKTNVSRISEVHEEKRVSARIVSDGVLRNLAEIRAKEALLKEKTRRDYESLRLELDEMTNQEKEAKEAAGKALRNITAPQLSQQEETRKANMIKAVENTFKRNIITCPPVDSTKQKAPPEKSCNVAAHKYLSKNDSSATVEQSKIPLKPNDDVTNLMKIERLKDLLEKINYQKKLLMQEIDIPGQDMEKIMHHIEKLEREKAALDTKPDENKLKMDELDAREQKLKEREKKLENGVRELYKTQKSIESTAAKEPISVTTSTSESTNSIPPVEILIKVQNSRKPKHSKTIRRLDTLHREPSKIYPRTPRKQKHSEIIVPEKSELGQVEQQTQTTPSLYEAPKPDQRSNNKVSPSLQVHSRKSDDSSISTTYQSLPEKINVALPANESIRKPHHKLNPILMHYITRLLGMGKNMSNQLHVDVSSVTTPGSSTINTSGNQSNNSDAQVPQFDQKRLEKLKEFINDNYSFLSEVNDSLERGQLQEQNDENINKVDGIWNAVLRKKKTSTTVISANNKKTTSPTRPLRSVKPKKATQAKTPEKVRPNTVFRPPVPAPTTQRIQSTLQPSASQNLPPSSSRPQITANDMWNVTKYLESHMLNNFSQYTANCQKRISDLAQMMDSVRKEKLKLIENSLSSGEFGHFTEYKEIAIPSRGQEAPTTSASDIKESSSQRDDPPSEEINNILQKQTRPFGVSKDSGISLWSRPVTSSDYRDSPDVRVTSEEKESTFRPILKDIPKPPQIKLTSADTGSTETLKDTSLVNKEHDEKAQRKLKPPLSLNRFSPHLEKPHEPHELSTIAEVETPSASKVNLLEKVEENIGPGIESFPNFDEYAKTLQAKIQEVGETSSSFVTLGDLNKVLDEMKLKSFSAPNDYGIKEITDEIVSNASSENSSIIDIVEELKRRDIFIEPFNYGDAYNKTQQEQTKSPKKVTTQNQILIKIPESAVIEIETTPKKLSLAEHSNHRESPKSNDTLTGIQELEKETKDDLGLQAMGLSWARSMLKRDAASKNLETTSTSSSECKERSIDIEIKTSTCERSSSSSNSNSIGHANPMNLREFLSRELKSKATREQSLSEESSLSSQFMRSLLKAASATSSSSSRSGEASDGEKVRTSTPIQGKGNSTAHKSSNTQLFLGESLSTLKGSDRGDSGKSDKSVTKN